MNKDIEQIPDTPDNRELIRSLKALRSQYTDLMGLVCEFVIEQMTQEKLTKKAAQSREIIITKR